METLFAYDRQIPNPEPWLARLEKNNPEALNEVVAALRHIIQIDGEFQNIETKFDPGDDKPHCIINIKRERPGGSPYTLPQRLDIASSGYRAVLALVCDVFAGLLAASKGDPRAARTAQAIVLIDEIEAHLHPRWKLQIISGLRRALPQATFIITTHDPLCLRGMMDGEVMMLNRYQSADPDSDMPEVVEPVQEFGNIEAFTIEQLLTSDLFQLFSTNDRRTEIGLANIADILAKDSSTLSIDEKAALQTFRDEITDALPYGHSEVSRVVQEAVADYLAERRKRDAGRASAARQRAKEEVKAFLEGLVE